MRVTRAVWLSTGSTLLLATLAVSAATAQDTDLEPTGEAQVEDALFAADELDSLVAPVALYPDTLLTQILVASTYPLDVVKADRFTERNADIAAADRADLALEEPWDESVQMLAGGFPSVVHLMAEEIEWTEDIGDAMLLQTDDLLDAIQRMRAQAVATGYLDSNEAQTVAIDETTDTIAIEPADPEIVYVPTYDPNAAFTSAPTATPVVYGTEDTGWSVGNTLATGAIAFGGAMVLNEIFDDDDDWDDYWRGPSIDWDDAEIYARPDRDIDIDGDVNIGRRPDRDFDGDRPIRELSDRDRPERDRPERNINVENNRNVDIDRNEVNIDRDRVDIDRERPDRERPDRERPGNGGRPERPDRPGIDGDGDGVASRPDRPDQELPVVDRPGTRPADRETAGWQPSRDKRDAARDRKKSRDRDAEPKARDRKKAKLKAGASDRDAQRDQARAKLSARKSGEGTGAAKRPAAKPKRDAALKSKKKGSRDVKKAANRGARSAEKAKLPSAKSKAAKSAKAKPKVSKPKQVSRPAPKRVSKPKVARKPQVRKPPKASAFKKPARSKKARAHSSRGKKSFKKRRRG